MTRNALVYLMLANTHSAPSHYSKLLSRHFKITRSILRGSGCKDRLLKLESHVVSVVTASFRCCHSLQAYKMDIDEIL